MLPVDEDEDGTVDEDPENDVDGDGHILQMRKKDKNGDWIIDKDDPRIMKRVDKDKGEKGEYKMFFSEGVDDDGDG